MDLKRGRHSDRGLKGVKEYGYGVNAASRHISWLKPSAENRFVHDNQTRAETGPSLLAWYLKMN